MKMKKNLFIIIFLLSANPANSQVIISLIFGETLNTGKVEFCLDGGLTLSSIDGIEGAKHLTCWNHGSSKSRIHCILNKKSTAYFPGFVRCEVIHFYKYSFDE
jgi:hypothetical protein